MAFENRGVFRALRSATAVSSAAHEKLLKKFYQNFYIWVWFKFGVGGVSNRCFFLSILCWGISRELFECGAKLRAVGKSHLARNVEHGEVGLREQVLGNSYFLKQNRLVNCHSRAFFEYPIDKLHRMIYNTINN